VFTEDPYSRSRTRSSGPRDQRPGSSYLWSHPHWAIMDPDDRASDRTRVAFHDAQYAEASRDDLDYYVDRALEASGPVLEIGCGTGRIYLELLREGIEADGIDLSAAALDVLREKAADASLDPSVRRADMTEFSTDRTI